MHFKQYLVDKNLIEQLTFPLAIEAFETYCR